MTDIPDGCLPHITSSGFSECNNTMIIKVPRNMKKPDESSFQFATIDPTKTDDEWPGDEYAQKLIPKLYEKAKVSKKHKVQEQESKTTGTKENRATMQPKLASSARPRMEKKRRYKVRRNYEWPNTKNRVDIDPWLDKNKMMQWQQKEWMGIQALNNVPIFNTKPNDSFHVAPSVIKKKGLLGDHPDSTIFQNNYLSHTDSTMRINHPSTSNFDHPSVSSFDHPSTSSFDHPSTSSFDHTSISNFDHPSTSNFDEFYPPSAINSSHIYRYNSGPVFKPKFSRISTPRRNSYNGNKPWWKNKLQNSPWKKKNFPKPGRKLRGMKKKLRPVQI